MDIQSFISSGILETYALGACTPAEAREVERMCAVHPEVKAELSNIEMAMEQAARTYALQPPAELKAKVISAVEKEINTNANRTTDAVPKPGSGGVNWSYLFASIAAAGLIAAAVLFMRQNETAQQLEQKNKELASCTEKSARMETIERQIALLKETQTRKFEINAIDPSNSRLAASVFENTIKGAVLVSTGGLGQAPAGKSYQLWALVDGKPVSMGVINTETNQDGFAEAPFVRGAQAYAISLEPLGGSPTPTEVIMISKS